MTVVKLAGFCSEMDSICINADLKVFLSTNEVYWPCSLLND
jgi:hypothetical protein